MRDSASPRPSIESLIELFGNAVSKFVDGEQDLFEVGINERSLTHKLAEYMQLFFETWNVDCEYNRLRDQVKVLPKPARTQTDDIEGMTIFPDIIVHKRKTDDNLLVVEVKKLGNNRHETDHYKLSELTRSDGYFSYDLGLHIILDPKNGRVSGATAFHLGRQSIDFTHIIQKRLGIG